MTGLGRRATAKPSKTYRTGLNVCNEAASRLADRGTGSGRRATVKPSKTHRTGLDVCNEAASRLAAWGTGLGEEIARVSLAVTESEATWPGQGRPWREYTGVDLGNLNMAGPGAVGTSIPLPAGIWRQKQQTRVLTWLK